MHNILKIATFLHSAVLVTVNHVSNFVVAFYHAKIINVRPLAIQVDFFFFF